MRRIKTMFAVMLCVLLSSCKGSAMPVAPDRSPACLLAAEDYTIRVWHGEERFEFVSPEGVAGTVVSFDEDGSCTISTPKAPDGEIEETLPPDGESFPGITVPTVNGRGYHDWLVLAYPEDYAADGRLDESGAGDFEYDGAVFTFDADGKCSVTRGGFTRSAVRTDEE